MRREEPQGSEQGDSDDRVGPLWPLCITVEFCNAPVLRC